MQAAQGRAPFPAFGRAQCKAVQAPRHALVAQHLASSAAASGTGGSRHRHFRTCAVAEPEGATRSGSPSSADALQHDQQAVLESQGGQGGSSSMSSERSGTAPLEQRQRQDELCLPEGRFSYKMVKAQPVSSRPNALAWQTPCACMRGLKSYGIDTAAACPAAEAAAFRAGGSSPDHACLATAATDSAWHSPHTPPPPLQVEVILAELRRRRLATWGRKDQLASREPWRRVRRTAEPGRC